MRFFSGPVAGYSCPAGLCGIRLELAAHPVLPLADRQVAVLLSLCAEGGRLAEAVSGQAGMRASGAEQPFKASGSADPLSG